MSAGAIKKNLRWEPGDQTRLLKWQNVSTVCEESRCPNRKECSDDKTATFLIGGDKCTRNCGFCHISNHPDKSVSEIAGDELKSILSAVRDLSIQFAVVTSVTRDDDPVGLALHFANIVSHLKTNNVLSELLIPDFQANEDCLQIIGDSNPAVIAHNIETVKRLSKSIRRAGSYEKSLNVLQYYRNNYPKIIIKSGLLTGFGENMDEIFQALDDLKNIGVDIVTIGQYLQPSENQIPVSRYYNANEFNDIRLYAESLGFAAIACGPFVRSSYKAAGFWRQAKMESL